MWREDLKTLLSCAGYFFGTPSEEIRVLNETKAQISKEVSEIRSIHLDLVNHSKLTRKIIKIDKQIAALKEAHVPRFQKVRKIGRVVRVRGLYYVIFNFIVLYCIVSDIEFEICGS